MKAVIIAIARSGADLIVGLLSLVALILAPTRIGRLLRYVSIPQFKTHKLRTSLSVFGIALGVGVLVAVLLVNRSITGSFEETINSISGKADLQVATGSNVGFDESYLDKVRDVPGVYKVAPLVSETVLMRNPGANGDRMMILGVDLLGKDDEYFRDYESNELPTIKENPIGFLNSTSNIIISNKVAKQYGLKLHDKLPLATPDGVKDFDIWGFVGDEGVGRTFGGSLGVMYYQSAQAAFGKGTRIDRVDVAVKNSGEIHNVEKAITAAIGEGFDVGRPDKRSERVHKLLAGFQNGLKLGSFLSLMVGAFLIFNTMSISVAQRKREIGILRALGTTRSVTLKMITLEGLLLGIVGSFLGVGIGVVLGQGMLRSMTAAVSETYLQVAANTLHLDVKLLAGAFLLGTVMSVGSAYFPARAAVSVSPLETIKARNLSTAHVDFKKFRLSDGLAIGFFLLTFVLLQIPPQAGEPVGALGATLTLSFTGALLAPRVIPILQAIFRKPSLSLMGVEGLMATENLSRDLGRTSIIAAAMMFGVAMTVAFGTFVGSLKTSVTDWIDQTLPADLFVSSASRNPWAKSVPMTDELYAQFGAINGVDEIVRSRVADLDYEGQPIKLASSDSGVALRRAKVVYLEGRQEEALPGMAGGGVLISENLARNMHKKLGDVMRLSTPNGMQEFKVFGVIVDYTWDRGTIQIDRATYTKYWGDTTVNMYMLYLKKGAVVEDVRRETITKYGEKFNLFVQTNAEVKGNILSLVDQTFMIMNALELVAMIIAALGIINSLLASVLDRVREIGVLRAVGMLPKKVRRMVVAEAGLIGLLGNILGLAVGLAFGYVLLYYINIAQSGWYFPFRPPVAMLIQTVVLVTIVSALAGWYPAREASRLRITEALEYD